MSKSSSKKDQIIWDLPTRLFHWLLVISFSIAYITHDDNRFLYFHVLAGSIFGGLILFRVFWGVAGTQYARFNNFAFSFKSVIEYLKGLLNGSAMRHIGHNPAGGWAIFLLLLLGTSIALSGAITFSGEESHGILLGLVPYSVAEFTREFHDIATNLILVLIAIHILGVFVESWIHKENLVGSMFNGKKQVSDEEQGVSVKQHPIIALFLILSFGFVSLFFLKGYMTENADQLYQPYKGPELATNDTWIEECSDCHMPYHPSLLPSRSWDKLFLNQHDHFGDDLDLDSETLASLKMFFDKNSAEKKVSEPARKILASSINKTPLRITDTLYWKQKHHEIDKRYWDLESVISKSNCGACHLDAAKNTFEDSNMRLPKTAF